MNGGREGKRGGMRGERMVWMREQDGERRVVVRGMDGWTNGDREVGGWEGRKEKEEGKRMGWKEGGSARKKKKRANVN